jgi:hypothetical protein
MATHACPLRAGKQTQTVCLFASLVEPDFPTKESQWQRGLEEWEGEIAKYEREYSKQFDQDLQRAILSEVAPKASTTQIALNSASLAT